MLFFGKDRIDYKLEDVVEINKKNPRHFMIPTKEEISNIKVGDKAKLVFKISNKNATITEERMRVEVKEKKGDYYTGILIDEPSQINTVKKGSKIRFVYQNIVSLKEDSVNIDLNSLVIITKSAVEKKEVNIAVKDNTFKSRKNNGWILYYGDESDTNGNNAELFTKLTVQEVLKFEPMLEHVFSKDDGDYVYNAQLNEFMKFDE